MEEFIQRLTALLRQNFPGSEVEFEAAGQRRVGGLLTWSGFEGHEQIDRQRQIWKVLRDNLPPEEQRQLSAVLTLTPDEMAAARED